MDVTTPGVPGPVSAIAYNPALDGLRAVAVLLVIGFHAKVPGFGNGYVGVDVFFALSGYLITTVLMASLARTGSVGWAAFARNRAIRLLPPLLLLIGSVVLLAPFFWPAANLPAEALLTGLYLSSYTFPVFGQPDILQHGWSLAVEVQFYLLWPFAVAWLARMKRRQAIRTLILLFVIATLWRFHVYLSSGEWAPAYYRSDARLSGLIAGALVAFAAPLMTQRLAAMVGAVSLALLLALLADPSWKLPRGVFAQPLLDIACAGLVASLAVAGGSRLARILSFRPLVATGLVSYGVYLFHYPIVRAFSTGADPLLVGATTVALSVVLAALSYRFLEAPLRKLKTRRPIAEATGRALADRVA